MTILDDILGKNIKNGDDYINMIFDNEYDEK